MSLAWLGFRVRVVYNKGAVRVSHAFLRIFCHEVAVMWVADVSCAARLGRFNV